MGHKGGLVPAPAIGERRVRDKARIWGTKADSCRGPGRGGLIFARVRIDQVMTHNVVSAETTASLREVAELMRYHNVGSVVITEGDRPVGMLTDRDLALAVVAEGVDPADPAGPHASRPLVTGEVRMELEEAAALMIEHHIRRLPLKDGDELAGIVTIDDVAVRAGDLGLAQQINAEVAKAALPEFFFHQRGG
jgi:CBS domain-containing protein